MIRTERRKSMVSTNGANQSSRKPAENYRERARAVLRQIFMVMQGLADPERWREPTEEEMERFIDEFHRVLNCGVRAARQDGIPAMYFPGPLTEEEMRFVERNFKRDVTIVRLD
jgi:hypothetical protein